MNSDYQNWIAASKGAGKEAPFTRKNQSPVSRAGIMRGIIAKGVKRTFDEDFKFVTRPFAFKSDQVRVELKDNGIKDFLYLTVVLNLLVNLLREDAGDFAADVEKPAQYLITFSAHDFSVEKLESVSA